jgi:hypothetical protein
MIKNPPSEREVRAAAEELKKRIRIKSKAASGHSPSWDEDRAWKAKHPSPSDRYQTKLNKIESDLQEKADAILLAGRMGQITSDEFYAKVKAF